jgi:hypothetical protein
VLVQSDLFECMRRHCDDCQECNIPLQVSSDGRYVSLSDSTPPCVPTTTTTTTTSTTIAQRKATSEGLGRFLRNVPGRDQWRQKQLELGLRTAEEYEQAIVAFRLQAYAGTVRPQCGELRTSNDKASLLAVGQRLALFTKTSLEGAKLQKAFAHFHVLLLLSFCELLRHWNFSPEVVDDLLQRGLGKRERDREKLLVSVRGVHRMIVEIVRKGWSLYRATELFFLSMLTECVKAQRY